MNKDEFEEIAQMVDAVRAGTANLHSFGQGLIYMMASSDTAWKDFSEILNLRFNTMKRLLTDTNFELSRAEVFITDPNWQKQENKDFVQGEIHKHFLDNWGLMNTGHCLKNKETVKCEYSLLLEKLKK